MFGWRCSLYMWRCLKGEAIPQNGKASFTCAQYFPEYTEKHVFFKRPCVTCETPFLSRKPWDIYLTDWCRRPTEQKSGSSGIHSIFSTGRSGMVTWNVSDPSPSSSAFARLNNQAHPPWLHTHTPSSKQIKPRHNWQLSFYSVHIPTWEVDNVFYADKIHNKLRTMRFQEFHGNFYRMNKIWNWKKWNALSGAMFLNQKFNNETLFSSVSGIGKKYQISFRCLLFPFLQITFMHMNNLIIKILHVK